MNKIILVFLYLIMSASTIFAFEEISCLITFEGNSWEIEYCTDVSNLRIQADETLFEENQVYSRWYNDLVDDECISDIHLEFIILKEGPYPYMFSDVKVRFVLPAGDYTFYNSGMTDSFTASFDRQSRLRAVGHMTNNQGNRFYVIDYEDRYLYLSADQVECDPLWEMTIEVAYVATVEQEISDVYDIFGRSNTDASIYPKVGDDLIIVGWFESCQATYLIFLNQNYYYVVDEDQIDVNAQIFSNPFMHYYPQQWGREVDCA